jgi:Na+/citrate or Na+/malate symporter
VLVQVGIAIKPLQTNQAFINLAFVFVVFSLVLIAVMFLVGSFSIVMWDLLTIRRSFVASCIMDKQRTANRDGAKLA